MELRKLQAIIQDGMAAFDETFTALFMKKTKVMMVLYQVGHFDVILFLCDISISCSSTSVIYQVFELILCGCRSLRIMWGCSDDLFVAFFLFTVVNNVVTESAMYVVLTEL